LSVVPPEGMSIKRGATASTKIKVNVRPGFHCNTNTPSDDYLIPLKLSFVPGTTGVEATTIAYPKGKDEKYSFSNKPLNVYSGEFEITATFKAAADAKRGVEKVTGKLRFQACNDSMCFAPKTIEFQLPVVISD
jgi:hypothetical protein